MLEHNKWMNKQSIVLYNTCISCKQMWGEEKSNAMKTLCISEIGPTYYKSIYIHAYMSKHVYDHKGYYFHYAT